MQAGLRTPLSFWVLGGWAVLNFGATITAGIMVVEVMRDSGLKAVVVRTRRHSCSFPLGVGGLRGACWRWFSVLDVFGFRALRVCWLRWYRWCGLSSAAVHALGAQQGGVTPIFGASRSLSRGGVLLGSSPHRSADHTLRQMDGARFRHCAVSWLGLSLVWFLQGLR